MVDSGSGQGHSVFATAGVVRLRRGLQKSENAAPGAKDAISDMDTTKHVLGPKSIKAMEALLLTHHHPGYKLYKSVNSSMECSLFSGS